MVESVYNLPLDPLIALYSAVPSQVTYSEFIQPYFVDLE